MAAADVNGVTYAKGLGVHAPSDVRFALGGACSLITALGRGRRRSRRGRQRGVPGVGRQRADAGLRQRGDDRGDGDQGGVGEPRGREYAAAGGDGRPGRRNGSDHADWADAKVTCSAPGTRRRRR